MIRANNEKELIEILKLISEESVKSAKRKLNETVDNAQASYSKALAYEESKYDTSLSEQEDNDDDTQSEPPEEEDKEAPEKEVEAEEVDPEKFGKSFEDVVGDINALRSGRSTKDKEIKQELISYFDRLNNSEQAILHLFIKELSDILKGAIEGDNAQDPSDPPFNFKITGGGEKKEEPAEEEERPEVKGGIENTTPPIKVNERQDLQEIRKRVARLMKRY